MARYAEGTTVPVEKTRREIEQLVVDRYQAKRYGIIDDHETGATAIQFELHDRRVMFRLRLPDPNDRIFWRDRAGRNRPPKSAEAAYQQERRRLWRSLLIVIKAKLESVDSGIESFEEAFLPQIVIPGTGQTYSEFSLPQIQRVYETQELPPMLPGATGDGALALGPGRSQQ